MHRVFRSLTTWILPTLALLLAVGCSEPAVGDPCLPETIPSGGFLSAQSYIETQSVECRTRVCVVYDFSGDPSITYEECLADGGDELTCGNNPTESDIDDGIYCSCRCDAPAGTSSPTCECPGGYECTELLEIGSDGFRGSYCVKE